MFELQTTELNDYDTVFDFALREMTQKIRVDLPYFASPRGQHSEVITLLLSAKGSGQTTLMLKLRDMRKIIFLMSMELKEMKRISIIL
jgi:hypothetical protein